MKPMLTIAALAAPLTAVLAAVLIAAPAIAHDYRFGDLEIGHPWARPAPAGATGGGFLTIRNNGKTAVTLKSASTPAARAVSIHQTSVTNGVARMAAMPAGLTIGPGDTAALAPGGYHLMLEGLTGPLSDGGKAPLALTFSNGQTVRVELAVQLRPPTAAPAAPATPGHAH